MSSELQQEIIDEYLAECEEILQRVTSGLALLERSEHDGETLNSIYRDMHTFKGSSMLFGFANAGEVAHVMEASLDPLRKSDLGLQLSSKFINIQFQCVDLLEKYLDGIRNGDFKGEVLNPQKIQLIGTVVDIASTEFGRAFDVSKPQFSEDLSTEKEYLKSEGYLLDSENPTEQEGAVARLAESALIEPAADSSSTFETDAKSAITAALSEALSNVSGIDDRRKEVDELFSEEAAKEAALAAVESARLAATEVLKDLDSGIEDIRSEIDELFAEEQFALEQKTAEMENQKAFESKKVVSIETSESKHITQNMVEAKTNGANVMSEDEKDAHHLKSPAKDVTIRVSVDLLDRLMNLVGELVLVRNQVSQYSLSYDDMEFTNLSQNLDVVTSDIQGEIMKTRMQPIGNVLNKYIRIVRDIASDLSKKIKLELVGVETELDK
ncbi:MAG: Hpt domain-containing protein, partial [Bdellovibrionales bacterium]|nr:Hpt domain-containing protein [Bdellovibrionales bacterium]